MSSEAEQERMGCHDDELGASARWKPTINLTDIAARSMIKR